MSFAYRSVRRRQAEVCGLLLLVGWAALGCTALLDIDGEYTIQTETGGADTAGFSGGGAGGAFVGLGGSWSESSGARSVDAGSGAGGGQVVVSTGGMSAAVGGFGGFGAEPATGGAPPQTTGGVPSTGGVPDVPDAAAPVCTTGKFMGTFSGTHAPSITVVALPLDVNGAVTFRLVESETNPRKLKVAEALFAGAFDIIRGVPGVRFTATMVGEYDCATKRLSGDLVKGSFADPEAQQTLIGFMGTFSATLGTQFNGTWEEVESTGAQFKGNGTFSARRVLR